MQFSQVVEFALRELLAGFARSHSAGEPTLQGTNFKFNQIFLPVLCPRDSQVVISPNDKHIVAVVRSFTKCTNRRKIQEERKILHS